MMPRGHVLFLTTCAAIWLLLLISRLNGLGIMDDAFMYVRYADHLLAHGSYAWNVEDGNAYGTTSVLYTFSLIPFRLLFPSAPAAALFTTSLFWGVIFLLLCWRITRRFIPEPAGKPGWKISFAMALVTACFPVLIRHFTSGMETTMALAWCAALIIFMLRAFTADAKPSAAWLGGIFAGTAFFMRPDLLVFALGIPGILFFWKAHRKAALFWGIPVVLLTAMQVGTAQAWLHSPVPLPFYAKSTNFYGDELLAEYANKALYEFALFLSDAWPACIILALGLLLNFRKLRRRYGPGEIAVLAASAVFAGYYLFFVTPIMGYWQRFYFPLLPFVLWLGTREWLRVMAELEHNAALHLGNLSRQATGWVAALTIAFLGYYGYQGVDQVWKRQATRVLFRFEINEMYKISKADYWYRLHEVSALPDEVSIATTEVGMVAAMNPGKRIIDLAGLNDTRLAEGTLSLTDALAAHPPDLIYLPHPHYVQMRKQLLQSPLLKDQYIVLEEDSLSAKAGKPMAMGVAILKNGKFASSIFPQLH